MADELKNLSLKVTYNEGWKEAVEEIKKDSEFTVEKLPEKYQEIYKNGDETTKDNVLHMYTIIRDANISKNATVEPIVRQDAESNNVVGLLCKIPVKGKDENYGNINVVILGNGSVVFEDEFKDLFGDYDNANTPEEKNKAAKVIKAKMAAVANLLTEAGVEKASLRKIESLLADKKQILQESLEQGVANGRQNQTDGFVDAGNSENDEDAKKLAEELYSQAAYIAGLEQDVQAGKASIDELKAARDKFNGALSGLGVQKGWFGLKKNAKTYSSIWGEQVFRLYPDEKSMTADGKINKDGTVNHTYSVEVKMKMKKGKLCMSYGLPAGKTLDNNMMKAMLDAYKAAGYKVVALPDGRPGKEYGDWWGAMASKQMVPSADKGPFPDPKDIDEMLKTVTEKGIGDKKAIEWIETMKKECEKKAKATGNSDMWDRCTSLGTRASQMKLEAQFYYSKTRYDKDGKKIGCFKLNMEEILNKIEVAKTSGVYRGDSFDTVDIISAARAVTEFSQKYWNGGQGGTMADLKGLVPDDLLDSKVSLTSIVTSEENMTMVIGYIAKNKRKDVVNEIKKRCRDGDDEAKSVPKILNEFMSQEVGKMKKALQATSKEFGDEKVPWDQLGTQRGKDDAVVDMLKKYQNNSKTNLSNVHGNGGR